MIRPSAPARRLARSRVLPRAFTLVELAVVAAIVAIVGGITVSAYGVLADTARLATAENAVVATLDAARVRAIRDGRPVVAAFRARRANANETYVQTLLAEWSGATFVDPVAGVVDRFIPVADEHPRRLPAGIRVVTPHYGANADLTWVGTADLAHDAGRRDGVVVAVMFDATGAVVTQRASGDAHRVFVDFDAAKTIAVSGQRQDGVTHQIGRAPHIDNHRYCGFGEAGGATVRQFFCQVAPDDEPYVTMAPRLGVIDAGAAAERQGRDFDGSIRDAACVIEPIHFNRYTGVPLR